MTEPVERNYEQDIAYHGNKNCNKDWLDGYFQAKKDLEMQLNEMQLTYDDLD